MTSAPIVASAPANHTRHSQGIELSLPRGSRIDYEWTRTATQTSPHDPRPGPNASSFSLTRASHRLQDRLERCSATGFDPSLDSGSDGQEDRKHALAATEAARSTSLRRIPSYRPDRRSAQRPASTGQRELHVSRTFSARYTGTHEPGSSSFRRSRRQVHNEEFCAANHTSREHGKRKPSSPPTGRAR